MFTKQLERNLNHFIEQCLSELKVQCTKAQQQESFAELKEKNVLLNLQDPKSNALTSLQTIVSIGHIISDKVNKCAAVNHDIYLSQLITVIKLFFLSYKDVEK
ncbi:hypothetical protein RFI_26875 [Reticulomyxa filosa]|uniref:Uncharacterized protein n=1 Tax=Reticulomyxa filosa TaxID=46433 RepID=X6MBS9_RETFI|nr:hypothetical protein RFI_26875 [Reticulomyxa filosa]|eukprot:ETO10500.1 hypothetical protein RFI_26875 [Reticulomyxa filosa]